MGTDVGVQTAAQVLQAAQQFLLAAGGGALHEHSGGKVRQHRVVDLSGVENQPGGGQGDVVILYQKHVHAVVEGEALHWRKLHRPWTGPCRRLRIGFFVFSRFAGVGAGPLFGEPVFLGLLATGHDTQYPAGVVEIGPGDAPDVFGRYRLQALQFCKGAARIVIEQCAVADGIDPATVGAEVGDGAHELLIDGLLKFLLADAAGLDAFDFGLHGPVDIFKRHAGGRGEGNTAQADIAHHHIVIIHVQGQAIAVHQALAEAGGIPGTEQAAQQGQGVTVRMIVAHGLPGEHVERQARQRVGDGLLETGPCRCLEGRARGLPLPLGISP